MRPKLCVLVLGLFVVMASWHYTELGSPARISNITEQELSGVSDIAGKYSGIAEISEKHTSSWENRNKLSDLIVNPSTEYKFPNVNSLRSYVSDKNITENYGPILINTNIFSHDHHNPEDHSHDSYDRTGYGPDTLSHDSYKYPGVSWSSWPSFGRSVSDIKKIPDMCEEIAQSVTLMADTFMDSVRGEKNIKKILNRPPDPLNPEEYDAWGDDLIRYLSWNISPLELPSKKSLVSMGITLMCEEFLRDRAFERRSSNEHQAPGIAEHINAGNLYFPAALDRKDGSGHDSWSSSVSDKKENSGVNNKKQYGNAEFMADLKRLLRHFGSGLLDNPGVTQDGGLNSTKSFVLEKQYNHHTRRSRSADYHGHQDNTYFSHIYPYSDTEGLQYLQSQEPEVHYKHPEPVYIYDEATVKPGKYVEVYPGAYQQEYHYSKLPRSYWLFHLFKALFGIWELLQTLAILYLLWKVAVLTVLPRETEPGLWGTLEYLMEYLGVPTTFAGLASQENVTHNLRNSDSEVQAAHKDEVFAFAVQRKEENAGSLHHNVVFKKNNDTSIAKNYTITKVGSSDMIEDKSYVLQNKTKENNGFGSLRRSKDIKHKRLELENFLQNLRSQRWQRLLQPGSLASQPQPIQMATQAPASPPAAAHLIS
ncbi:uncharacterized protein LOC108682479 [Hyalella azteca]|uniref:Uncharacterized protein LOC108682479 n=1 Tax=Hyalella azteca TaxID=294128 RepID=A0A8B7PP86_HYAAZ|nr:uncharacterized protein LOC108682479 [Hyalella azteca]